MSESMARWLEEKKEKEKQGGRLGLDAKNAATAAEVFFRLRHGGRPASWPQFFAGSGYSQVLLATLAQNATSSYANSFCFPFSGGLSASTTEANVQYAFPYPLTLRRIIGGILANSLNGSTTLEFHDDGTEIGGAITRAAANTDDIDSGELNVPIAAGSALTWRRDLSGSSSGSLSYSVVAVLEMKTIW